LRLHPRYDGPAVIDVDEIVGDPSEAVVRQRARLAEELAGFSPREWAAPSRCADWNVQDVVEHLVSVNRFWIHSVDEGLRGSPTRLLADFDPVSVPASMVDAARGRPPSATMDAFVTSNDRLASLWTSLGGPEWSTAAEAPPGHLALRAVAAHALWDAWIHERDVLLPLGHEQPAEADEIELALAYAATLGPAYAACVESEVRTATLGVRAHDPELVLTVEIGEVVSVRHGLDGAPTAVIEGDAVGLVDGLSVRGSPPVIAGEHRWLLSGLETVFDDGSAVEPPMATRDRP
jgi:uncharacterized protein (TIGR03083 family)